VTERKETKERGKKEERNLFSVIQDYHAFSTNTLLSLHRLAQIVHCFVEKHLLVPALTAAECFITSGEKREKKRNNYIITEQ